MLGKELKNVVKKDVSNEAFTDAIFKTCLEKFGPMTTKYEGEPKQFRRRRELQELKKDKKMLKKCWKVAGEDGKVGLLVLWKEVKMKVVYSK